jgi:hypothetical protein
MFDDADVTGRTRVLGEMPGITVEIVSNVTILGNVELAR